MTFKKDAPVNLFVKYSYMGHFHFNFANYLNRQSNSPSLRRKTEGAEARCSASMDPRRRSNLEVPRTSFASSNNDANRKSEALSPCIAITVPRTNIVTPWEGES